MFEAWEMSHVVVRAKHATKCVHFAVHVRMCESLILSCTLHASSKSPVNQTQDYDCCHLVKGTDNV